MRNGETMGGKEGGRRTTWEGGMETAKAIMIVNASSLISVHVAITPTFHYTLNYTCTQ